MKRKTTKISLLYTTIIITIFFIVIIFSIKKYNHSIEHLVNLLKIYTAYDHKKPIKLIRLGQDNDGGYIVPELAIQKAHALLGYGIDQDISFEEQFSERYNKPSYGFDCGITQIKIKNKLCHFIPECISNKKFLYHTQKSTKFYKKISSFAQQINKLNLTKKPIFIKMDIEGAEYDALPEILNYAANITGIVIEIHMHNYQQIKKAINLLYKLNNQFLLIHIHANNYNSMNKNITLSSDILELTYINKSLVHKFKVADPKDYYLSIDMPNDPNQKEIKWMNAK